MILILLFQLLVTLCLNTTPAVHVGTAFYGNVVLIFKDKCKAKSRYISGLSLQQTFHHTGQGVDNTLQIFFLQQRFVQETLADRFLEWIRPGRAEVRH